MPCVPPMNHGDRSILGQSFDGLIVVVIVVVVVAATVVAGDDDDEDGLDVISPHRPIRFT